MFAEMSVDFRMISVRGRNFVHIISCASHTDPAVEAGTTTRESRGAFSLIFELAYLRPSTAKLALTGPLFVTVDSSQVSEVDAKRTELSPR
jgi:hypothetical protein